MGTNVDRWPNRYIMACVFVPLYGWLWAQSNSVSQFLQGGVIFGLLALFALYLLMMAYRAAMGERGAATAPVGETSSSMGPAQAAGVFVVIAVVVGWFFWGRHYVGAPDYAVTAIELAEEFQANELAAANKYMGKVVEVAGIYSEGGVTLGAPWMILAPHVSLQGIAGVQCFFPRGRIEQAASFVEGGEVRLKGVVNGAGPMVTMHKCATAQ